MVYRHRPQGHPERADRRPAVRLQGRVVRALRPPQGLHGQEGRRRLNRGSATPTTRQPRRRDKQHTPDTPHPPPGCVHAAPEPVLSSGHAMTGWEPSPPTPITEEKSDQDEEGCRDEQRVNYTGRHHAKEHTHTYTRTHTPKHMYIKMSNVVVSRRTSHDRRRDKDQARSDQVANITARHHQSIP